MIKILCIGNSFSQDATALIEVLSKDFFVRNLFIPSCSLEKHVSLLENEEKEYEYQKNGERCLLNKVSLKDALSFEKWDYITIQQASGFSGIQESYYPFINTLIEFVKKCSNAEIVFHQTWTYEKNSNHKHFIYYDNSNKKMWQGINNASRFVCEKEKIRMIPTGEMIEKLRNEPFFDIEKLGTSIQRDGFHLSLDYGRTAAACVWIKFFTNTIPEYMYSKDLSDGYKIIKEKLENSWI